MDINIITKFSVGLCCWAQLNQLITAYISVFECSMCIVTVIKPLSLVLKIDEVFECLVLRHDRSAKRIKVLQ